MGGCSLGSIWWGSNDLPQKSEYKFPLPPKKNTKNNRTNSRTRIGGCSLGSLRWGVRRFTQPHKHKDEDWWLFPGFASVGCRTIYHKKVNISIPPPKKKQQQQHNHTNSRTRIGG